MPAFNYRQIIVGKSDAPAQPRSGYVSPSIAVESNIDAYEGVAPFDELVRLLKLGRLMPSDLVFSHGIWRPFAESPEFFDVCDELPLRWIHW